MGTLLIVPLLVMLSVSGFWGMADRVAAAGPAELKEPIVFVSDEELHLQTPVLLEQGRALVPMRAFFEALGGRVSWEADTRTAVGFRDGIEIRLPIGKKEALVNGRPVALEVPSRIYQNRTYIPLRFVGEAWGDEVKWEPGFRRIDVLRTLPAVEDLEPVRMGTPILGPTASTVNRAQVWARTRGAHPRFVELAPLYWEYGARTGIRPEILYCQSAKETAFGRFGGVLDENWNNWAGIKTSEGGPCGDPHSHQRFPSPEEGVRAHFNHMSAYLGVSPLGEPHGRYYTVVQLPWAGSIRFVEELGGRWAPSADYGNSIVRDYLQDLLTF